MYSQQQIARARDQYNSTALASRIEASGPHGLVALLYEELGRALDVIGVALSSESRPVSGAHVERAQSILIALEGGLDFQRGAGLALQLSRIYRSMRVELQKSVYERDPAALNKLRDALTDLASSWDNIARQ